jgi:hypothetical protein
VFGVNAFPGLTLLDVLEQGGGPLNALGRHAVAAFLNAASGFYPLTTTQVVNLFVAAFATGDYETAKNTLEGFNEARCPLS